MDRHGLDDVEHVLVGSIRNRTLVTSAEQIQLVDAGEVFHEALTHSTQRWAREHRRVRDVRDHARTGCRDHVLSECDELDEVALDVPLELQLVAFTNRRAIERSILVDDSPGLGGEVR